MAFEELGGAAAGIGDVHRAIAGRVFGWLGPVGAPARAVHDAVSAGVYCALRRRSLGLEQTPCSVAGMWPTAARCP